MRHLITACLLAIACAVAVCLCADRLWPCAESRYEGQRDVPQIQADVWGRAVAAIERSAWTNPMQPRAPDMPGGLR